MFQQLDKDAKIEHLLHEKTTNIFGETTDDSFAFEVEAEREYVVRLKTQREKIEALYSKYDVLLKELKNRDFQIREKDKTISHLQSRCKTFDATTQENDIFRQQNREIKSDNLTLQRAVEELEESYTHLHGQFKSKEVSNGRRLQELEMLNEELMHKLKALQGKYLEKEEEHTSKYNELWGKFEEFKGEVKKERETFTHELAATKSALLQKEEETTLLKTDNNCLKERVLELESAVNQMSIEHEEILETFNKERKIQLRALKKEIEGLTEANHLLERRMVKIKEECHLKDMSLNEISLSLSEHEKTSTETVTLLKHDFTQERSALKEQLIQAQNHIARLERKLADGAKKEQTLHGRIKKYEVCLDAKRNLREIERSELDRINMLLNLQ